jgi:cytochrome P450
LSLYPDVQRKAQDHIDQILGDAEYPTYDQIDQLTYIHHIEREVLRLYPAAVGTVRKTRKEFEFKNYVIPKDVS